MAITSPEFVVGHSPRMRAVFDYLRIIGNSDSTVLVTGESGTGKEVTATLVHHNSRRRHQPFVPVSCALFSETLIESELFGHERGAFTGAIKDRPGRFELAEGGTIFLDDIDDIPLSMQVKLLRVLQNRTVERLGGTRPVSIDVRIVAGTKRDLRQLVAEGKFREDLFYRLNVLPVTLPPLRERPEDIPVLMEHFLRRYFRRRGEEVPPVSNAVKEVFSRYTWPGNVRELENACERIAQTCSCRTVRVGCMPANILFRAAASHPHPTLAALDAGTTFDVPTLGSSHRAGGGPASAVEPPTQPPAPPSGGSFHPIGVAPVSLDDRLREVETSLINWALTLTGGNKSKAAALLKIKRSTLGDRISRCGIGEGSESEVAV